jgi:hypothetical protein
MTLASIQASFSCPSIVYLRPESLPVYPGSDIKPSLFILYSLNDKWK